MKYMQEAIIKKCANGFMVMCERNYGEGEAFPHSQIRVFLDLDSCLNFIKEGMSDKK